MDRESLNSGPVVFPNVLRPVAPNNSPAKKKNSGPILSKKKLPPLTSKPVLLAPNTSNLFAESQKAPPFEIPVRYSVIPPVFGTATVTSNLDPSLQSVPLRQGYSASEAGKLMARIDAQQSVGGMIKNIRYTHNTDIAGFMGLLATGRFLAAVEPNINWRLDVDSRYATGLTYIMKQGFFRKYRHYYFDDMYAKGYLLGALKEKLQKITKEIFEQKGGESKEWQEYFSLLTALSDFRKFQVCESGLEPTGIKLGAEWTVNQKSILKENSKISSVNPQLRIAWQADAGKLPQIISAEDIDAVIMTKHAYDSINIMDLDKIFEGFTNRVMLDPNKKNLGLKYNVKEAIKKFNVWKASGRIKVLENTKGFNQYSHQAGREGKRSFRGGEEIKSSARQGLEFHQDFHLPGAGNNSASAYSMPVFLLIQQEYFKHLVLTNTQADDLRSEVYQQAYKAERLTFSQAAIFV